MIQAVLLVALCAVSSSRAQERATSHSAIIDCSDEELWTAFTTEAGLVKAWSVAKAKLDVSTDAAAIDSLVNAKQSAVDMFREAGEQAGPADRIRGYRRVAETYPDDAYAPQALFMVGFVESEENRDYDRADTAFRELIARYPNSELAVSAQWMIDNMRSDKTPEFELPGDLGPADAKDGAENKNP